MSSVPFPFSSSATVVTLFVLIDLCVFVWLGVFVSPQGAGQAINVGLSDMPVLSYSKPQT